MSDINVVDAGLVAALVLSALAGLRRGLIRELLDLAGLLLGGWAALQLYHLPGEWIADVVGLQPPTSDLAGFFAVFIVAVWLLSALGNLVADLLSPFVPFFLKPLGSLGGAAVGLFQGVLFLALLLRAFALIPLDTPIKEVVAQSRVADRLGSALSAVLPYVENATNSLAQNLVPAPAPIHEGERRELNIPRDLTVWNDPDSEAVMLQLLNQERQAAGLKPLVADEPLRAVARAHSEEMFRLAYFAHESPLTGSPFDRLRKAGIRFGVAGENLAYAPTVEIAHRGLMNSPDHKRNILTPEFRRVGIGVVKSNLWGRMFSQEFTD